MLQLFTVAVAEAVVAVIVFARKKDAKKSLSRSMYWYLVTWEGI